MRLQHLWDHVSTSGDRSVCFVLECIRLNESQDCSFLTPMKRFVKSLGVFALAGGS